MIKILNESSMSICNTFYTCHKCFKMYILITLILTLCIKMSSLQYNHWIFPALILLRQMHWCHRHICVLHFYQTVQMRYKNALRYIYKIKTRSRARVKIKIPKNKVIGYKVNANLTVCVRLR